MVKGEFSLKVERKIRHSEYGTFYTYPSWPKIEGTSDTCVLWENVHGDCDGGFMTTTP